MSEQDEQKPLTRRERRLLEMDQQTAAEGSTPAPDPVDPEPVPVENVAELQTRSTEEIEISPYDEEGQPRTRREIRLLRDAAIAAHSDDTEEGDDSETPVESSAQDEDVQDKDVQDEDVQPVEDREHKEDVEGATDITEVDEADVSDDTDDTDNVVTVDVVEDEDEDEDDNDAVEATDATVVEPDDLRLAPTQPLSLEELFDLNDDNGEPEGSEASDAVEDEDEDDVAAGAGVESHDDDQADVTLPEPRSAIPVIDSETPDSEEAEATEEPDTADDSSELSDSDDDGYSFPDIQPLAEERSVFDDPSVRTVSTPSTDQDATQSDGSGFEDMIQRAIADEGSSVHSGTASLILPASPESDGLSGPIGDTGELFITGSIEMPRSLGETGGHSKIHETIESDPFALLEIGEDFETGEHDSAPVSARRAVSSRSGESTGLVSPEVQKGSKLPLILAISGGGLIVVLVGAGIWAFSSGLFG